MEENSSAVDLGEVEQEVTNDTHGCINVDGAKDALAGRLPDIRASAYRDQELGFLRLDAQDAET
jgi:hypothetical protein